MSKQRIAKVSNFIEKVAAYDIMTLGLTLMRHYLLRTQNQVHRQR